MQFEAIHYEADVIMIGALYRPKSTEPAPGVLVFSDIFGLGDHAHERAAQLAELGYVAIAADIHGEGKVLATELAMQQLGAFQANPSLALGRAQAALTKLCSLPDVDVTRIAAIGFCFGGALAFDLARAGTDLLAAVGFHSTLSTSNPHGASLIKGKILAFIGSEDPIVPAEQRVNFESEMRASTVDWQLHVYGGTYHSFTDRRVDAWGRPAVSRYNAAADQRSWAAMRTLLEGVFQNDGAMSSAA